ncbi:MAG: hypothetical protein ACTSYR_01460, partial [Candidatus Odinarchaeia archaeon]
MTAEHIESFIARTSGRRETDLWGAYIERAPKVEEASRRIRQMLIQGYSVRSIFKELEKQGLVYDKRSIMDEIHRSVQEMGYRQRMGREIIGAKAKQFYGNQMALDYIRRILEDDIRKSKYSIIKELQQRGLGYTKAYMRSDINLIRGEILANRYVSLASPALVPLEVTRSGVLSGALADFRQELARQRRNILSFGRTYTNVVRRIRSESRSLHVPFSVLSEALNDVQRSFRTLSTTVGMFTRSVGMMVAGIPEILVMTAAFSALYKAIEEVGKTYTEAVRRRASVERYVKSVEEWTYEDIKEMWAEYQELKGQKLNLTYFERKDYEGLQKRQLEGWELSAEDKEALKNYDERIKKAQKLVELEERLSALGKFYHPQYGMISVTKAEDLETVIAAAERKFGKRVRHRTKEEEESASGSLLPADPKFITQIETRINKVLNTINSRYSELKNRIDMVQQSYMGLGHSVTYVNSMLSEMSSLHNEAIRAYNEIQKQIPYVNQQLNEEIERLERWKETSKRAYEVYEAYLSGKITEEDARKHYEDFSENELNTYKLRKENIERLENTQQKLNEQSSQYLRNMQEIQKTMFQTVMNSIKYAGVWDSIQKRINLVKQSIAEIRLMKLEPGLTLRIAGLGEKIFGQGWDKYGFMTERFSSNVDKLWNTLIQLEESIALYGDDQKKLQQVLDEIRYGELGSQLKEAVTDPLSRKADSIIGATDKNTQASEDNTDAVKDLTNAVRDAEEKGLKGTGLTSQAWYYKGEKGSSKEKASPLAMYYGVEDKQPKMPGTISREGVIDIIESVADLYNVPLPIMMGMIERESSFNPSTIGDSGRSIGLGQINLDVKRNWNILKDVASKYGEVVRSEADAIRLLKHPRINAEVTAIRIKQDLEAAKGDLIGFLRNYVGIKIPWEEINKRLAAFEKYGLNISRERIISEHKEAGSEAVQQRAEVLKEINRQSLLLHDYLLAGLKNLDQTVGVIQELREAFPFAQLPKETELYLEKINEVFDAIKKAPDLFTDEMRDAIQNVADEYYDVFIKGIHKEYKDRARINARLALIDENLAQKRSEILRSAIDELIEAAYTVPADKLNDIFKWISELNKELLTVRKGEVWKDILKNLNIQLTMSKLTGTPMDWSNIGSNILSSLQNLLSEFPQYADEIESQIREVQAFIDRVKYDSSAQSAEVLKYIRNLQSTTFGTPEYYKQVANVKSAYNNLYTLEEKVADLTEIFQSLVTEIPDIYNQLSEVKTTKISRDLYVLVEQLRQISDRLDKVTPLSVEYFSVLSDIVDLHTRENELLTQREELTKRYFELTAKGLDEYVKVAGQVQAYYANLLQAQIARTRSTFGRNEYEGTDEYYVLLGELVSLEKQWLNILSERRDVLTEGFKLGVIGLREYIEGLNELTNNLYNTRTVILDFYNSISSGIKSDFSKALADAFSGSLTYQGDFVNSIKQTLSTVVSEAIANVVFEATGMKAKLQGIITGITESVYSGGQIDVESLRQDLGDLLNTLYGYLPAYKDLLSGIFETLKDNVYNAPTGFKI